MKKIKIWSMMMLVALALPMMVACGGDDDNGGGGSNDGSAATYTEQEVMDILKGQWEVYGHLSLESTKINFSGDYKANLKFDPNNANVKKYLFKILEGDKYHLESGEDYYLEYSFIGYGGSNYDQKYSLIKKDGKYYIEFNLFDSSTHFYFEIQSLTKTSFRMLLDEDYEGTDSQTKEKIRYHVRMTLISK